jgi:hypothetical protein
MSVNDLIIPASIEVLNHGLTRNAILVAGGILVRHDADDDKIAIVRRRRYPGEMTLPKGKIR